MTKTEIVEQLRYQAASQDYLQYGDPGDFLRRIAAAVEALPDAPDRSSLEARVDAYLDKVLPDASPTPNSNSFDVAHLAELERMAKQSADNPLLGPQDQARLAIFKKKLDDDQQRESPSPVVSKKGPWEALGITVQDRMGETQLTVNESPNPALDAKIIAIMLNRAEEIPASKAPE